MAHFELMEDWEWPKPDNKRYVIEPFEMRCLWPDGVQKTLVWAVPFSEMWGALVFFRPLEQPEGQQRNYVSLRQDLPNKSPFNSAHLVPRYGLLRDNERPGLEQFLLDFRLHPVRYFQFFYRSHTKRAFIEDGQGWWSHNFSTDSRFRFPFPNHQTTGAWIFEWLQAQMQAAHEGGTPPIDTLFPCPDPAQDPAVEVRFAYLWDLDFERINHYEALFASELWPPEIDGLMRLIKQSESELTRELCWYPRIAEESMKLHYSNARKRHLPPPPTLTLRLEIWSALLKREFPLQDVTQNLLPLCLLDTYLAYYGIELSIRGSNDFSAHERLEASVELREWAQDKATPEEMEVLFPSA